MDRRSSTTPLQPRRAFGTQLSANSPLPNQRNNQQRRQLSRSVTKTPGNGQTNEELQNAQKNNSGALKSSESRAGAREDILEDEGKKLLERFNDTLSSGTINDVGSAIRNQFAITTRNGKKLDTTNVNAVSRRTDGIGNESNNNISYQSPSQSSKRNSQKEGVGVLIEDAVDAAVDDSPLSMESVLLTPATIKSSNNNTPTTSYSSNTSALDKRQLLTTISSTIPAASPSNSSSLNTAPSTGNDEFSKQITSFSDIATQRKKPLPALSTSFAINSSTSLPPIPSSTRSTASTYSTFSTFSTVSSTSTSSSASLFSGAEYAIKFPPGPLHLQLEPVVHTLGRPMGCCIAKFLPEFEEPTYIPLSSLLSSLSSPSKEVIQENVVLGDMDHPQGQDSKEDEDQPTIQVNDLFVSINGISVLSRKFEIIADLLQRFKDSEKTIVFRSLEKVWRTQRQRRLRRKLAATTATLDQNNHEHQNWVETPTRISIERTPLADSDAGFGKGFRFDDSEIQGKEGSGDSRHDEEKSQGVIGNGLHPKRTLDSGAGKVGGKTKDITYESQPLPPPSSATPSKYDKKSVIVFSPSNVKKIARIESATLSSTPSKVMASSNSASATKNGKHKGINSSKTPVINNKSRTVNSSSKTPKGEQSLTDRIGKVLVGKASGNNDFQRALRLKKDVLKELDRVRLALVDKNIGVSYALPTVKQQVAETSQQGSTINDYIHNFFANTDNITREKLMDEAEQLQRKLGPNSLQYFLDRLVEVQLILRDEMTKSFSMQNELEQLRADSTDKDRKINLMSHEFMERTATISELQQKIHLAYEAMNESTEQHRLSMETTEKESMNVQSNLESEVAELRAMLSHVEGERDNALQRMNYAQVQLKESTEKVTKLEQTVEKSLQSEKASHDSIISLKDELLQTKAFKDECLSTAESQKETISRMHQSIDEMEMANKVLQNETSVLRTDLNRTKEDLENSVKKRQEREGELSTEIEQKNAELAESRLDFNQREAVRAEEIRNLEKLLETEQERALEKANHHAATILKLEECVSSVTSERDDFRVELKKARLALSDIEMILMEERQLSEKNISDAESILSDLRSNLETQARELAGKEAELCHALSLTNDLQLKVEEQKGAVENLEAEKSEMLVHLHAVESDRDAVRSELEKARSASSVVKRILEAEKEELERKIAAGKSTLSDLRSTLESKTSELNEKEVELLNLNAKMSSLENQASYLKNELDMKEETGRSAIENIETEKSNLLLRLKSVMSERDDAQLELEKSLATSSDLKRKLTEEKELLERKIASSENIQLDLTSHAELQARELSSLEKNVNDLELREEKFRITIENIGAEKSALSVRLQTVELQRDDMQLELINVQSALSDMEITSAKEKEQFERIITDGERIQSDLSSKVEAKELDLAEKKSELMDAIAKTSSLERDLAEKEAQLLDINSKVIALESQVLSLSNDLRLNREERKNAIKASEVERSELLCRLDAAESQRDALHLELDKKTTKEKEHFERKIADGESILSYLRSNSEKMKSELAKKDTDLLDAIAKVSNLESKVSSLLNDIEQKEKIGRSAVEDLNAEKSELLHLSQALESELDEARIELSKARSASSEAEKKTAKEMELFERQVADGESIRSDLQSRLETKERELVDKDAKLLDLASKLSSLESQMSSLSHELELSEAKQKVAVDQLNDERSELLRRLQALESEQNETCFQLEKARSTASVMETKFSEENELLKRKITDGESMLSDLNSQLDATGLALVEKEAELTSYRHEVEQQIHDLEGQINFCEGKLKIEIAASNEREKGLSDELDGLKSDVAREVAEKAELQSNILLLTAELAKKENKRASLASDNASFVKETEELRSNIRLIEEEKQTVFDEFINKERRLLHEVEGLKAMIEAEKTEKAALRSKLDSLRKKLDTDRIQLDDLLLEIQNQLHLSEARGKSEREALRATESQLRDEIAQLEINLSLKDEGASALLSKIKMLESEVTSAESKRVDLEENICSLRDMCADAEAARDKNNLEFVSLATAMELKDSEVAKAKSEQQELEAKLQKHLLELDMLREETQEGANHQADLNARLNSMSIKLESESSKMSTLTSERNTIELKLNEANTTLQSKESIIVDLKSLLEKSQAEGVKDKEVVMAQRDQIESLKTALTNAYSSEDDLREKLVLRAAEVKSKEEETVILCDKINKLNSQLSVSEANALEKRDALEAEITKISSTAVRLEADLTEAKTTHAALCSDLETEAINLSKKEADVLELTAQREDLITKTQDLSSRIELLEAQSLQANEMTNAEKVHLNDSIAVLTSEREELKAHVSNVSREVELLEAKSLKDEDEKCQLFNEVEALRNVITEKNVESSRLSVQLESTRAKLNTKETELVALVEDNNIFSNKLNFMHDERKELEEKSKTMQIQLASRIEALQCDVRKEKASCADFTANVLSLTATLVLKQKELSAANENIELLKVEANTAKDTFESARLLFESELHSLKDQIEFLSTELRSCREDIVNNKSLYHVDKVLHENHLAEKDKLLRKKSSDIDQLMVELTLMKDSRDSYRAVTYKAKQSDTMLRSKIEQQKTALQNTHMDICQFSKDLACAKGQIVLDIAETKNCAEIALKDAMESFVANERILQEEISNLNHKIQSKDDDVESIKKGHQTAISLYTAEIESLKSTLQDIERAYVDASSQNVEMESIIQRQENEMHCTAHDLRLAEDEIEHMKIEGSKIHQEEINRLQERYTSETQLLVDNSIDLHKKIETCTNEWAVEATSLKENISCLNDEAKEARLSNGILLSRLDEVSFTLQQRERSVARLSADLCLLQDVILSMQAEVNCSKLVKQELETCFSSERELLQKGIRVLKDELHMQHALSLLEKEEMQQKIFFLSDKLKTSSENNKEEKLILESERNSVNSMLGNPALAMISNEATDLRPFENGRSLLVSRVSETNSVSNIFHQKGTEALTLNASVDVTLNSPQYTNTEEQQILATSSLGAIESSFEETVNKLKEENRRLKNDFSSMKNEKSSRLETLVAEINQMYERIESHTSMVENELTSKATEIGSLKQRLAIDNLNLNRTMGMSNSNETYQHGPSLTSVEHDLRELCHIFAVNFTDAHTSRPKTEVIISMLNALKPALMSLISTHDGVRDIQQERGEIHELKSQIEDAKQRILDTSTKLIDETSAKKVLERKCIEFESQLLQSQSVHQKLEFKYENAKTEIADCQQLAIELKKIVVGKNKDIESKENIIMDLQFKIDEFTARVDGLAAMGINVDTDLSSPEGSKNERVLAHKMITAEVTNLEKQILALEIELQQQSSMHKSIVDGLESHCKMLAEEIDEAKDYICTLEDLQDRLEANVEELKKESKDKSRKCSDLSTACNILRHQKAILEKSNSGVMSGVRKLVEIVALNSTRVNGFSSTTRPPQSWSLELEYIVQFIQQAVKTNQKYLLDIEKAKEGGRLLQICESPVTADAITPKAKGRSTTLKVTNFVSKHAATLNDIKNTKDIIKNVMASPRLTPMKAANHERNETYDKSYDDDLYSDLVVAVEQLELLSERIEQFEEEESKWNATEISFKTRIQELEQEVQDHVANKATHSTNLTLKQQDEKLKEIGATMIYNFHQRQRKAMLVHAFQNCRAQARLSKHLNLAKEMAKELIETRKKVLLLKHHFDSS